MRLKVFIALAIVVAGLLGGFGVAPVKAQVTITETRITTDIGYQSCPDIYGDRIVWMDYRNGQHDIYVYDLSTGTETQITTDPASQLYPAIYGDRIVWEDSRNYATADWDIYVYDLSTGTETRITTDPAYQSDPAIYGDRIVWQDRRSGNYDIFMYDLSTGTETQITIDPADQQHPAIYGDRIVWEDGRDYRGIYMYDLSTSTETRLTTSPYYYQEDLAVYGNRIVWRDSRNTYWDPYNYDIYMYDLSTGTETQITPSTDTQGEPAIYGDRIVWMDWSYMRYNTDIFMYDLSTGMETQITTNTADQFHPAIYGDRIVWQDLRGPGDNPSDIYMAELSFVPTPSAALAQTESIKAIVADSSQIPRSDFDGATDTAKDNRRGALLNKLDAVIEDIEAAMASTRPRFQKAAYQSAIDQLNSILDKTDGCSERGTPDTEASGYTPDWITTCASQKKIDPLIRDLITMVQTLLAQIP